ncbi:MAG: hypothetical protein MUE73_21665, partial [Planctomycetes bacterium]|nr:hypothetical protein [Planctomycetota bacterium]
FALGALPYILDFLAAPRAGLGSAEALAARVPDLVSLPAHAVLATFGPMALFLAVPLALRLPGLAMPRRLLALLALALLLALPGGLLTANIAALTQLQLLRFTRILGFLALVPVAALLGSLLAHRGLRPAALAGASVMIALLFTGTIQEHWFDRAGRRLFGRPAPAVPPAPSRPRGGELRGRPEEDRAAYLRFTGRCRRETSVDALFLVPPEDLSHFRLYARRSIVVDRKAGGFAVTLLGRKGLDWLARYREAVALYAERDTSRLLTWCRARGVDYVVAELPHDDFGLPVVFREGPFVLHAVPPR